MKKVLHMDFLENIFNSSPKSEDRRSKTEDENLKNFKSASLLLSSDFGLPAIE